MSATTLRDRLHAKRVEITKLHTDVERCDASTATGESHRQAVAALKKQRETVVAEAFLNNATPDTKKLDKQIADAEQAHRAAIDLGAAAANAKAILEERIAKSEAELQALEKENQQVASQTCGELWEAAIAEYSKAFQHVVSALAGIREVAITQGSFSESASAHKVKLYDVLIQSINQDGLVSAPPVYRAPGILSHRVEWEDREPHAVRIAKALEKAGIEMPDHLAEFISKEVA
ncbi:MAG: hypothetical protein M3O74_06800 [Pseudomonadota bacterium]|nr:hypothetical protein [Pseudomonadota bacterium]